VVAAVEGAERTADMQAAFGRAKNIGERSIGHVDPGAASMSLVFTGLKKGLGKGRSPR
jgi:dihydroxyacetone kinase-like protein